MYKIIKWKVLSNYVPVVLFIITGILFISIWRGLDEEYNIGGGIASDVPQGPSTFVAYATSPEDGVVIIDYIDVLEGLEAKKAEIADGVSCVSTSTVRSAHSNCFSSGSYFYNRSTKLSTLHASPDLKVVRVSERKIASVNDRETLMVQQYKNFPFFRITLDSKNVVIGMEEVPVP